MNYQNARITYQEIRKQEMNESIKNGYGISVKYSEDDFNPRSKEYWFERYPAFNEIQCRFIDMDAIMEKKLIKIREKYPAKKSKRGVKKGNFYGARISIKVRNIVTGKIYGSIREAAKANNLSYTQLRYRLGQGTISYLAYWK